LNSLVFTIYIKKNEGLGFINLKLNEYFNEEVIIHQLIVLKYLITFNRKEKVERPCGIVIVIP